MLKKFSVVNFKNFKSKVVFDLENACNYEFSEDAINDGTVAKGIIYGKNSSGKSNLALALFDIILHLTDKEKLFVKYEPYLNLNSKKPAAEFEYVFGFNGKRITYKYSKRNALTLVYETLLIDGEEVIHYDFSANEGYTTLKGAETLNLVSRNPISRVKYIRSNALLVETDANNIAFLQFMSFVDNMLMFYSLDNKGYQGLIVGPDSFTQGIVRAGKTKEFEKFLNEQGVECQLVEREINGVKDLFCHFDKADIAFTIVSSTGTISLALFYYWYLLMNKATLIFIDEFDAFYHYELSEEIIKIVKGFKDKQIFVSTHNTDLLTNDLLRPDCYFLLQDGKLNSLDKLTDKDLRKAHNIQKMYKAGSFNA